MRKLVIALAVTALAAAGGAALLWPDARAAIARAIQAVQDTPAKKPRGHDHAHGHDHGGDGVIKLSSEQIARASIETAPAGKATLIRGVSVPGTVSPDSDRVGRVAAKVVGTVAELRKRLGDHVTKGEVIAVLESREVADAKSDHLTALVQFDLQKTLFEREQALWSMKISAEQQFLRVRNAFKEAELRVNVTRQKLSALDLTDEEISGLPAQPLAKLRQKEIRAPVSGQVVERRVDLGAPVGSEGQEHELYVIADLSHVWVELSVPMADLAAVKDGQAVTISSDRVGRRGNGRIIFVSPVLNPETRSARVIAAIDNKDRTFRPGSFVTATIVVEEQEAEITVPRTALQTVAGEQVVFVRTEDGFEKREIVLGRSDDKHAEIVFGLDPGETIAVTNAFVLKAELGKSEAGHDHAH